MGVAVWDTYARIGNGNVLHFDIFVPDGSADAEAIFRYGKAFLASRGEVDAVLSASECQYCHMEEPTAEVAAAIARDGHYILELEEIPSSLPAEPSRRDVILHLRGFFAQHRFADFKGKSLEEVQIIYSEALAGE